MRIILFPCLLALVGCATSEGAYVENDHQGVIHKKAYAVESWGDTDVEVKGDGQVVVRETTSFEKEILSLRSLTQKMREKFYFEFTDFEACYIQLKTRRPDVARVYKEFAPTPMDVDKQPAHHDKFIVDVETGDVVKEQLLAEVLLSERKHQQEVKALWMRMKSSRHNCEQTLGGLAMAPMSEEEGRQLDRRGH